MCTLFARAWHNIKLSTGVTCFLLLIYLDYFDDLSLCKLSCLSLGVGKFEVFICKVLDMINSILSVWYLSGCADCAASACVCALCSVREKRIRSRTVGQMQCERFYNSVIDFVGWGEAFSTAPHRAASCRQQPPVPHAHTLSRLLRVRITHMVVWVYVCVCIKNWNRFLHSSCLHGMPQSCRAWSFFCVLFFGFARPFVVIILYLAAPRAHTHYLHRCVRV